MRKLFLVPAATFTILMTFLGMHPASAADAQAGQKPPTERPAGYNDSGAQLNRTRRYLEEQAILQRIEEGRKKEKVETEVQTQQEESAAIKFTLKKVNTTESKVLTEAEIAEVTEPYMEQEVTLQDLYKIVGSINEKYTKKGYLTCQAFLAPQRIHDGEVLITLIEGKTADVQLNGAKSTRANYIRHRVDLARGEVKNINELNEDLLRFNAMNDVQLRIQLKPGAEVGTTDYVLTVQEPQTMVTGIFADNAGSKTSGEYREGMYWLDRSLTGNRDTLFLSAQRSDGTKSVSASYVTPVNRNGTKVGASYSTNSVHITDGALEPLDVLGHSYAYSLFLTNPMQTTEKVKSQWGVEVGRQHSVTDFAGGAAKWVDDTLKTGQVYVDQINYGKSTVFYQKHAYRFGNYVNILDNSRNFGKYTANMLFQKVFAHGQNWTLKLDGQIAGNEYMPSAEMYYIGGMYSVRGYKESALGGDSGYTWSAEYALPVEHGGTKNVMGYAFVEGGSVYGDSAFDDHMLASAGFGVRTNLGKKMSANVGVGIPLIRTLNGEEQSRSRFFFNLNGQY